MTDAGAPQTKRLTRTSMVGRLAAMVAAGVIIGSIASAVWGSDGAQNTPAASPATNVARPPVVSGFIDDMTVQPSPTLTLNYSSGVRWWKNWAASHAGHAFGTPADPQS